MRCVLFACLLFSTGALADAIEEEPENCPNGSDGWSSHAGTWCQELTCDADEECPQGTDCETSSVCLNVYETNCGGEFSFDSGESCTVEVREVLGDCESDDDCDVGTCVTDTRCIDPEDVDTLAGDCEGCSQAHMAGGAAGVLGVLSLVSLLRRRD